MSYSLKLQKGGYIGGNIQGITCTIGVIKGDARSLDDSSNNYQYSEFLVYLMV